MLMRLYDGSKQRNGRIRLRKCFARKRVGVKEIECGVWDLNQMMCILCIHSCVQKYACMHQNTAERPKLVKQ